MNNLYPFKKNYLDLNGNKYHYLDEGEGAPVVMLHGNPTWSFYYRDVVKALLKTHRSIVPDHIGCGLSDKPEESKYKYTLSQRIDDLEKLIDNLNIKSKITLILHDWGGMIGMGYASRHPEKIERLVILNTGAFHLPKGKKLPLSLKIGRTPILGKLLIRGLNGFALPASFVCTVKSMPGEIRKEYLKPYNSWKNRIATLKFVEDIPLLATDNGYDIITDVENTLCKFKELPMVIFWGEKDFVFDHTFYAEWVKRFPKAQTYKYPNAGHYVLEDAGQEIIPLIKEFLASNK
jgi:haloalkane dehalogenase